MKKEITYYTKCLCCGSIQSFILRDEHSSMQDQSVLELIQMTCEPCNRVRVKWCDICSMSTKQEEVGWDFDDEEIANPPVL